MSNSTPTENQIARADELIGLLCEGKLPLEHVSELDQLVVEFSHIRKGYVELMSLHSDLRQQAALLKPQDSTDSSALNAIADQAARHPTQTIEEPAPSAANLPAARADLNETFILPAIDTDVEPNDEEPAIDLPKLHLPPPAPKRLPWRIAAVILLPLITLGLFWAIHGRSGAGKTTIAISHPAPNPIIPWQCVVNLAVNAQWADARDPAPTGGTALAPGIHSLSSGMIKLELRGNAMVVIESPARFEVLTANKIQLFRGKLCALLTTGGGLTVVTPDLTAVDMGTEFALDVDPGKQTHLEVLQGNVRAALGNADVSDTFKTVVAGEAVKVPTGATAIQTDTPRPLAFLRPSQVQAGDETSYQRWTRFSQIIRQDADLVAYYPFDSESAASNRLENRATQTAGSYTGTLGAAGVPGSSPVWTKGRWSDKAGLQFGGAQLTAVTVATQPELITETALTLCCWIKRADLDKPLHLLAGEKEGARAFNLGIIRKGTTDPANRINLTWSQFNVASTPASFQVNQWEFVATSSTVENGTRFYLDGKLVSSNPSPGSVPVAVNQLMIGAPVPGNKLASSSDYFNGLMDELLIYRRALSSEEIAQLYKMGLPG